ncbi:MAG TPA: DUF3108 domain-containing protein [Thermoanaerobaculia bacterium]|jgi:hypothetical protein|nr:DUF3108 domain-containing protein [Thermoanaerobaculia bacterium]
MKISRIVIAAALTMAVSASASASDMEQFRYSWRLRGGVRLLAGLLFPTSGVANLQTKFGDTIHSELLITAPTGKEGGFYAYESDMDERGAKTLMTYHGYSWGKKARNERTVFDHVKGLARIHKQTTEETENRVKKLPASNDQVRDILTAIVYLRQNAISMAQPVATTIYSDGKEYPVIFKPGATKLFTVEGHSVTARAFHIVDAPGGKKWPGGVTVWLTSDDRRIPVRIEIQQSMASLQLDLTKIEASALMARL